MRNCRCRPNAQKTVHEDDSYLVVEGCCAFDSSSGPEPVRILLSAAAPDIFQSAVAFDERRARHSARDIFMATLRRGPAVLHVSPPPLTPR